MKHIKIFEEYNEVPDIARDLLGLNKTFKIYDIFGDTGITISGPLEEEEMAQVIIKMIHSGILAIAGQHGRNPVDDFWISLVNDLVEKYQPELSKIGYHVDSWYNIK
jgi:hypothetical protein